MTLTFVTNYVHHHQLPMADEFYRLLGDDYHYIAAEELPESFVKGGYDPTLERSYIVRSYQSEYDMAIARKLIDESDVVIHGAAPEEWSIKRKQADKVTFHYSERWLKHVDYHAFTPRKLMSVYRNYFRFRHGRLYMLCASAYTAQDVHKYSCFPNRCFRWGYFTKVDSDFEVEAPEQGASTSGITPLMWCSRFLKWKHPELPILLAARLKAKGYRFTIDMFGGGEEFEKAQKLIVEKNVDDCVKLCGNRPNDEILEEMRRHEIFLFTSDRHEGWGAVLNEAMANGSVPVASDAIGSVPFLIKNGENGFVFRSCDIDSFENAVITLLDDTERRQLMRKEACETMKNAWSPRVAAKNFMELAKHALEGTLGEYKRTKGPASRVE